MLGLRIVREILTRSRKTCSFKQVTGFQFIAEISAFDNSKTVVFDSLVGFEEWMSDYTFQIYMRTSDVAFKSGCFTNCDCHCRLCQWLRARGIIYQKQNLDRAVYLKSYRLKIA